MAKTPNASQLKTRPFPDLSYLRPSLWRYLSVAGLCITLGFLNTRARDEPLTTYDIAFASLVFLLVVATAHRANRAKLRGDIAQATGRFDEARLAYHLAARRARASVLMHGLVLLNLAMLEWKAGRNDVALSVLSAAWKEVRHWPLLRWQIAALFANVWNATGDDLAAAAWLAEANRCTGRAAEELVAADVARDQSRLFWVGITGVLVGFIALYVATQRYHNTVVDDALVRSLPFALTCATGFAVLVWRRARRWRATRTQKWCHGFLIGQFGTIGAAMLGTSAYLASNILLDNGQPTRVNSGIVEWKPFDDQGNLLVTYQNPRDPDRWWDQIIGGDIARDIEAGGNYLVFELHPGGFGLTWADDPKVE